MNSIRIITLRQPWASLIALGLKKYETRSWPTTYRGKLVIHAAKRDYGIGSHEETSARKACELAGWGKFEQRTLNFLGNLHPTRPRSFSDLPLGCIVAIADLTDCQQMAPSLEAPTNSAISIAEQTELEESVGVWEPGRFAWRLENVVALAEPIPFKGAQGLLPLSDETVLQSIAQQTGGAA